MGQISVSATKTIIGRKAWKARERGPLESSGAKKTASAIPLSSATFLPLREVVVKTIRTPGLGKCKYETYRCAQCGAWHYGAAFSRPSIRNRLLLEVESP